MEVFSIIMVGIAIVAATVFFIRSDKTMQLVDEAYKKHSRRIPSLLNLAFLPDQPSLSDEQKRLIASLTDSEWEEWEELIVKVSAIANAFPASFDEFLKECYPDIPKRNLYKEPSSKNSPIKTTLPNKIECLTFYELRSIESEPKDVWEKRNLERIEASTLLNKCPEGGKDYIRLRETSFVSSAEILRNKERILNKQKRYNEYHIYDGWEKKQESFCSDIWNINKKFLPNNGRYTYMVPFQKPKFDGTLKVSEFKIWQFFSSSCSFYLQEKQTEQFKDLLTKIPEFANKKRFYYNNVYDGVYSFIEGITNAFVESPLTIFVTSNSKKWSEDTFDYHYKHLRSRLDENEYTWCNLNDIQSINDNAVYKSVIIIDFISTNDEIKKNSAYVIEFFKQSIPFVCYYSMIKEYDEDELLKLADKHDGFLLPKEYDDSEYLELIKASILKTKKAARYSYLAIPNTWIGNAVGAESTKKTWLNNPDILKFRTKRENGFLSGEYSTDGGNNFVEIAIEGDTNNVEDMALFSYQLFKKMGVLSQFKENGDKAIEYMNTKGFLIR